MFTGLLNKLPYIHTIQTLKIIFLIDGEKKSRTTTTNLVESSLTENNMRSLVLMVIRIQNYAKNLEFTSNFSIKESYHTSFPIYLYLIRKPRYSSVGQKEVQTIQALTYVWNSPALSPFASIETKPVSFLCSLKPFLNMIKSLFCSPQKNSLHE